MKTDLIKALGWLSMIFFILFVSCSKWIGHYQDEGNFPDLNSISINDSDEVLINEDEIGDSLPSKFLGFSYETSVLINNPSFLSTKNITLINLLKNLGVGILRIGGNSSDLINWNNNQRLANTAKNEITKTEIDQIANFSRAVSWQVLFGLNLGNFNLLDASQESFYVSKILGGNLYGFQFGNEPDFYSGVSNIRAKNYSFKNFQEEWKAYLDTVRLNSKLIAGPDIANNSGWRNEFARNYRQNIFLLTSHYYMTNILTNPLIVSTSLLEKDIKLDSFLMKNNYLKKYYNLPYRISECNSVNQGGREGISNVFASALWGLDFMWKVAQNGGSGINFHGGPNLTYTPIDLVQNTTTPRPLYYGMLAFHYGAIGNMIKTSQTSKNVSIYASKKKNKCYVTLINKSALNLKFGLKFRNVIDSAQFCYLLASSINAREKMMFANETVKKDGNFVINVPQNKFINSNKAFVILPAYSALVVILKQKN